MDTFWVRCVGKKWVYRRKEMEEKGERERDSASDIFENNDMIKSEETIFDNLYKPM